MKTINTIEELREHCKYKIDSIKNYLWHKEQVLCIGDVRDLKLECEAMIKVYRRILSKLPEPKEEKSAQEFDIRDYGGIYGGDLGEFRSDVQSVHKMLRDYTAQSSQESDYISLRKELADFLVWYSGTPRAGRTTNACIDMYMNFKTESQKHE